MTTLTEASATEKAICDGLGSTLPTRSRADTQQTISEITRHYAAFAAVCPSATSLIPK